MQRRELLTRALLIGTALAAVYGLKRHASTATAEDLRWLLTPTAALVGVARAGHFVWVPAEGYLDGEARFLIAPSCAGVNFLSATLLTAVAGVARSSAPAWVRWASLPAAAAVALSVTVIVNALRISLAISLHQHPWWTPVFLSEADAHQLLGITVYAGALTALYAAAHRGWEGRARA